MSLVEIPAGSGAPARAGVFRRLWDGPRSRAGRRAALAAVTAAGSAVLAVLYFNDPAEGDHLLFPPCPFHALTGWYCPGCGSTRGLHQLLHGHVAAALKLNCLMVACVPYLAYAYVAFAARVSFPDARWADPRRAPVKGYWIGLIAVLICLYWVLRNVPVYPFSLLAPH